MSPPTAQHIAPMGRVLGRPGTGLIDASFARNAQVAKVGRRGELDTAAMLDALVLHPGCGTVMHDVRIPIPGISANIDHILISGNKVWIIDTKVWKPAFYWTLGGHSHRGLKPAPHLDKGTIPMAVNGIGGLLRGKGIHFSLHRPTLVVHPSSTKAPMHLWAARTPGAQIIEFTKFQPKAARFVTRTADPAIVAALEPFLN